MFLVVFFHLYPKIFPFKILFLLLSAFSLLFMCLFFWGSPQWRQKQAVIQTSLSTELVLSFLSHNFWPCSYLCPTSCSCHFSFSSDVPILFLYLLVFLFLLLLFLLFLLLSLFLTLASVLVYISVLILFNYFLFLFMVFSISCYIPNHRFVSLLS